MNRGEARQFARFLLDDKTANLIGDPDLNVMLDMAVYKTVGLIRRLKDEYFAKSAMLATVSGTRAYAFTAVASDVHRIRFIEKNSSPKYARLERVDWLTHKLEFDATGEPGYYAELNKTIYLLAVPNAVLNYTVFYDQTITLPTSDANEIPVIPVEYHDLVAIWAAMLAAQGLAQYLKVGAGVIGIIGDLLSARQNDLSLELTGKRWDDVEVSAGTVGSDAGGGG
jgi:hypothetical protein